jgi:class 3 adenylate cyclase
MEPRIQYAKTADGVSIAFWTLGEGPPLVYMPILSSHCEMEWQFPEIRSFYERLAQGRMLVRYDGRGTGLSEREATDFSLDARMLDLEAVVERLGLERFAMLAPFTAGPVAISYAARRPERVSHLLLWSSYARGSDILQSPRAAIFGLVDQDWVLYTETMAHATLGWSEGEQAHRFAAMMRESTTQEVVKLAISEFLDVNVTGLLPLVRSPTVVLHRRDGPVPLHVARGLASRIPGARLVTLEGSSLSPMAGAVEVVLRVIDEFLGEGEAAAPEPQRPTRAAVHTILFTDVEGSTAMTQRLGDARAREVMREHERITRECLRAHGGSEVKTMGDGFMASFGSAVKALECAIAVQKAFATRNESNETPIRVRIGLNAGEPIAEDDPDGRGDLFGTAVIRAARIAAMAQGGEILTANVVRELAEGKGFVLGDRGEVALRGFDDPVRLFEVRWQEEA